MVVKWLARVEVLVQKMDLFSNRYVESLMDLKDAFDFRDI